VKKEGRSEKGAHAGTERRSETPDRRKVRRGGRRAGDVVKKVAKFVHQLLTEPPK